jgi:microcin C transport system substrate-binding protein
MTSEVLLGLHPTTLEYIPGLATHWQISPDKMTYRFRIDPNARYSNGEPVTAQDFVGTFDLLMDKGTQERLVEYFKAFDRPVAESKYILRVHAKELRWQNFYHFATALPAFPSSVLKGLTGEQYVKNFNFKILPGSGPYTVNETDIVKGKSLTFRRRKDYWAADRRGNVGANNFDNLTYTVIRDQNLALQMLKKGDLDYYPVNISREWIQEFNFPQIQRGLILKRKVYNDSPPSLGLFAFNTRRPPYNDLRVRKALALLFDRKKLIEQLFFNEYVPLNSFFPRSVYENKNNPKNDFDPMAALKLLGDAGYNSRDGQGRLTKSGQPLTIEFLYPDKGEERFLTIYQDDLRKVGVTLNLRLVTGETMQQLVDQRNYDVADWGWGTTLFPDNDTEFQSTLADVKGSNNITGFRNARVDQILVEYDKEFDLQKRIKLMQELDGILSNDYQYVYKWDSPFQRLAYWNKYGQPDSYFTRTGDPLLDMPLLWWLDPDRNQALTKALSDDSVKLPTGTVDVKYWPDYDAKHPAGGDIPGQ